MARPDQTERVVGMSSWVGWLLLFAGAYLAVVMVGIVKFVAWFFEDRWGSHRRQRSLPEPKAPHDKAQGAGQPRFGQPSQGKSGTGPLPQPARLGAGDPQSGPLDRGDVRRLEGPVLPRQLRLLGRPCLAQTDPRKKVADLSKALALNPSYEPAWGLKGNTLLGMERYAEALECFEKALEHPSQCHGAVQDRALLLPPEAPRGRAGVLRPGHGLLSGRLFLVQGRGEQEDLLEDERRRRGRQPLREVLAAAEADGAECLAGGFRRPEHRSQARGEDRDQGQVPRIAGDDGSSRPRRWPAPRSPPKPFHACGSSWAASG